jgi:hypothetical protein
MVLEGHSDIQVLCLALSGWSDQLRILQDEQRRRKPPQRRERVGMAEDQALTE